MLHSLVNPGMETLTQLDLVTERGNNEVQGFLLGRPTADPGLHFCSREELSEFPDSEVSAESPKSGESS